MTKSELVDEKVISRQQGVFHATGGDLDCFGHESPDKENNHHREDQ